MHKLVEKQDVAVFGHVVCLTVNREKGCGSSSIRCRTDGKKGLMIAEQWSWNKWKRQENKGQL